jgi:hypothetical protein
VSKDGKMKRKCLCPCKKFKLKVPASEVEIIPS